MGLVDVVLVAVADAIAGQIVAGWDSEAGRLAWSSTGELLFRLRDQRRQSHAYCLGQPMGHVEAWIALSPLDQADVGPMDTRLVGQDLLRDALFLAVSLDQKAKDGGKGLACHLAGG